MVSNGRVDVDVVVLVGLRLSLGRIEVHGRKRCLIGIGYMTMLLLESFNVVGEGSHESLGMLGRQDDARLDFSLGYVRYDAHKIYHELRLRVGDDGEVRINAFGDVFG